MSVHCLIKVMNKCNQMYNYTMTMNEKIVLRNIRMIRITLVIWNIICFGATYMMLRYLFQSAGLYWIPGINILSLIISVRLRNKLSNVSIEICAHGFIRLANYVEYKKYIQPRKTMCDMLNDMVPVDIKKIIISYYDDLYEEAVRLLKESNELAVQF